MDSKIDPKLIPNGSQIDHQSIPNRLQNRVHVHHPLMRQPPGRQVGEALSHLSNASGLLVSGLCFWLDATSLPDAESFWQYFHIGCTLVAYQIDCALLRTARRFAIGSHRYGTSRKLRHVYPARGHPVLKNHFFGGPNLVLHLDEVLREMAFCVGFLWS